MAKHPASCWKRWASAGRAIPPTYAVDGEEWDINVGTANRASDQEIAPNSAYDMGNPFDD
jgi:hypothetical protein